MSATSNIDSDFLSWCRQDAGIVAPKVDIVCNDNDYRSLVATDTIYPGERFMYIPSSSLLCAATVNKNSRIEKWKEQLSNENSELYSLASSIGYTLREDDVMALYLIMGRYNDVTAKDTTSEEEAEISTLDESLPIIVAQPASEYQAIPVALTHDTADTINVTDEAVAEAAVVDIDNDNNDSNTNKKESTLSFSRYIRTLPSSFPTLPLYYSDQELERIHGTNAYEYTQRMKQQIYTDWSHITTLLNSINDDSDDIISSIFTLEAYQWALCNIYSRSTDFTLCRVMAPLFDMMNHSFDSKVTHAMDNDGNLSVYNDSQDATIEPGDEICLCYGHFSNEKLLLVYGFVIENNPYNSVALYAPLPDTDPILYRAKVGLLDNICGINDVQQAHYLHITKENVVKIPSSLLSVLRLMGVQSMQDFINVSQQCIQSRAVPMLSIEHERQALLALQQALYTMARQVALCLIDDSNLSAASRLDDPLRGGSNNDNDQAVDNNTVSIQNAKILCRGEFQILQLALNEVYEQLQALEASIGTEQ